MLVLSDNRGTIKPIRKSYFPTVQQYHCCFTSGINSESASRVQTFCLNPALSTIAFKMKWNSFVYRGAWGLFSALPSPLGLQNAVLSEEHALGSEKAVLTLIRKDQTFWRGKAG